MDTYGFNDEFDKLISRNCCVELAKKLDRHHLHDKNGYLAKLVEGHTIHDFKGFVSGETK